jgi:hypothetical protein
MRVLASAIILMLLASNIKAQDTTIVVNQTVETTKEKKKKNIWIGPKFGMDLTHFSYNADELVNDLAGNYQFGILCQIGKKLYLQPELMYATYKSATYDTDSTRLNYLKIPLMLGWRIINLGIVSVHLKGGPQFSFQLAEKDKLIPNSKKMSWQVGAGVDVLGFITTDLRYTLQPGKTIAEQIDSFDPNSTGLNLTVGLKLR